MGATISDQGKYRIKNNKATGSKGFSYKTLKLAVIRPDLFVKMFEVCLKEGICFFPHLISFRSIHLLETTSTVFYNSLLPIVESDNCLSERQYWFPCVYSKDTITLRTR